MKRSIIIVALGLFVGSLAQAQTVAVYPVKTEGFTLNQSDVIEMHRVAMQACYDAGFKCSGRGDTKGNVSQEQQLAGGGKLAPAAYVAECALTGKTENRNNFGLGKGGIPIFTGAGKTIGGVHVGGGTVLNAHGINIGTSGMNLACQFSSTTDGTLAYSESDEKMGLSGELVIVEHRSSNVKKLQSGFEKMFKHAKEKLAN